MLRRVTLVASRVQGYVRHVGLLAGGLAAAAGVALLMWAAGGRAAHVSVFPNSQTLAASAVTAITFRGVDPGGIEAVTVAGSRSGPHPGRLQPHPDGQGAVFGPHRPFAPGERVTIDLRVAGSDEKRSTFVVARSLSASAARFDKAKAPHDDAVQRFRSRPDLRPPTVAVETVTDPAAPGMVFLVPNAERPSRGR